MSSSPTMPMISPDGDIGDIPQENVSDAVKAGYKIGQDMLSPDGKLGTIPLDKVHDAIKAGFLMKGANPKAPNPDMQEAGISVPDAGRIPGQASTGNKVTDKQAAGGLAAGAVAGGAPLAAEVVGAEAIPSVLPHTIAGVKAIGSWAQKNPVAAWGTLQLLKELIPGAKKAMGLIKDAPGD